MIKIGIDLGGTKIEIVALDEQNQPLVRRRVATEQERGYETILDNIAGLYRETVAGLGPAEHTLGIGIPGSISAKTQRVKNSNTLCLNHQSLQVDLAARLGRPLRVENDANCFALTETLLGAGRGKQLVFGVIMGTGCGAGIVWDGKVHPGLQGIAGEWGHMQIDPAGPACYCGKRGCVETYISGGGLQRLYQQQVGATVTVQQIVAGYRAGEVGASQVFGDFIQHFGIALSNVIDILDPDMVILGGGLSNIDELYTLGRTAVAGTIFSDSLETPIVRNVCGDSAGVFGAALIGI